MGDSVFFKVSIRICESNDRPWWDKVWVACPLSFAQVIADQRASHGSAKLASPWIA
jgi:hypothetical protein